MQDKTYSYFLRKSSLSLYDQKLNILWIDEIQPWKLHHECRFLDQINIHV